MMTDGLTVIGGQTIGGWTGARIKRETAMLKTGS
jgi:hypothetical protein